MPDKFRRARRGYNLIRGARDFIRNSRVKKTGVSQIRKSAGHFSDSFTQRASPAYFSGVKSALKAARSFGST
jgi:hypothetical protein